MRDKIKHILQKRLGVNSIAKQAKLPADVVLSYLALMVFDNEVTFYEAKYTTRTGQQNSLLRFKTRGKNEPISPRSIRKGVETRAKILKTIRELLQIGGSPTIRGIMARSKLSKQAVKKGLKILIDNGVIYSTKREGNGKTLFYLFTKDRHRRFKQWY